MRTQPPRPEDGKPDRYKSHPGTVYDVAPARDYAPITCPGCKANGVHTYRANCTEIPF